MDSTESDTNAAASPSSPPPKRSRRSAQRRVVSVPIPVAGECAPPADSWAWRKYGQKPIKGSPYPRGYYRCSSSKGCPARKQVERSSADPATLVVTYACEHNHATKHTAVPDPDPIARGPRPGPIADPEESGFPDLIGGDLWCSDVGPTSPLYGPIFVGTADAAAVEIGDFEGGGGDEDDALFAGLGELPECSAVFGQRQVALRTAVRQ